MPGGELIPALVIWLILPHQRFYAHQLGVSGQFKIWLVTIELEFYYSKKGHKVILGEASGNTQRRG